MSSNTQLCPVCGSPVPAGSRFCPNCGHAMPPSEGAPGSPVGNATPPLGSPTVKVGGQTTYIPLQGSFADAGTQSSLPAQVQSYSQAALGVGRQSTSNIISGGIVPTGLQRDPMIALLLELVGYVFVLGLGHMYAGRVGRGIALLLGYWLYWAIAGTLFLTLLLSPIACLMALLHPVVPILSGLWAKRDLDRERMAGGPYRAY